ncbi:MAG: ACT domain-containing protein [Lentisphaeria bacterium]|nr:ACT domain-containing protein [Lentisphaeria bacterium]
MKLEVIQEKFTVCKVADYDGINLEHPFVFTGCTDAEKSLVCPTALVPQNTLAREDGWQAFRIVGILDFSLVGILAKISSCLADNGIGLFAISTFNTDYILIKSDSFDRALDALAKNGYSISGKHELFGRP